MPQVCDDARAGAVLNKLTVCRISTRQGTPLYTLTVNTLAAADFLLTHAANPDRGYGSLRFVYGAAGYLDMTKLHPVIFAVPAADWRTKGRLSVIGDGLYVYSWLNMSGTSAWPAV